MDSPPPPSDPPASGGAAEGEVGDSEVGDSEVGDRKVGDSKVGDSKVGDSEGRDVGGARRVRSGRSGRPRRRGRRLGILGVIVVIVVGWSAADAIHLLHADHRLRAGIAAAEQVRAGLNSEGLLAGEDGGDLAAAAADFDAAHADITSFWLAPLHIVPILDTQIRSVEDLSGAAAAVSGTGRATLTTARAVLAAPHTTPAERASDIQRLAVSVASLERVVSGVSLGPDRDLLPTLASKRDTFADDLAEVQGGLIRAAGATGALAQVLTGPRTYLVLATNNAEMRAGSGMMLDAGTLTFHRGAISLGHFEPTSQLATKSSTVAASGDLAARWGFAHPAYDFRALMLSPQFGPNASLAARMWQERTGQHVDGVMTVDVGALADLLAVTGPVTLDGTTYTSSNVTHELLVSQYDGLVTGSATAARHERLGALAATVLEAVENGNTSITALAKAFDAAVDGRHIMVWSDNSVIEQDWADAGAAGSVVGDDLLLSVLNESADKLDPYLQVTSQLRVDPARGRTLVTDRVTIRNTTPATVTGYAAGGGAGTAPVRQYDGGVALDFPSYAGSATATGGALEASGADYASEVLAAEVTIPDGASHTVTFRFTVLGTTGELDIQPSARLPTTQWSWSRPGAPTMTFDDASAHQITW